MSFFVNIFCCPADRSSIAIFDKERTRKFIYTVMSPLWWNLTYNGYTFFLIWSNLRGRLKTRIQHFSVTFSSSVSRILSTKSGLTTSVQKYVWYGKIPKYGFQLFSICICPNSARANVPLAHLLPPTVMCFSLQHTGFIVAAKICR